MLRLEDFLFPKFCLSCGSIGVYICNNCRHKLSWFNFDICFYCQKTSYLGLTHPSCCKPNRIDGIMYIFYYNDFMKKIIKSIKYRLAYKILEELFPLIPKEKSEKINELIKLKDIGFFEPVPLHSKRSRSRGFNQAQLIAEYLSKLFNRPLSYFLVRNKPTASQAQLLSRKSRRSNVGGAFSVKKKLDCQSLLLVDDVVTSGATVSEAAKTLKKNGVDQVFVFALAKG